MNAQPLISVIIPIFNREKYIEECIRSTLAQTYPNIEIICIDDASTDASVELLKQFLPRITIITQKENQGSGYTRNVGIDAAQGEFLAFLDSDDLWEKDKLEKQLQQFKTYPDLAISMTNMKNFISPELNSGILEFQAPIPGITTSPMMLRKQDFLKVGYFNKTLADFPDWFIRAKQLQLVIKILPEALVLRRIHDTNIGRQLQKDSRDYLTVVRKFLKSKK